MTLCFGVNAQDDKIKEVIEDFRMGIINLDDQQKWSDMFLHDSITWAMIKEGKTQQVQNATDPSFRFFSSDPISFFEFLKGKKEDLFEEKFYDVKIYSSGDFATVDFLYTFTSNGEVLNWGKEYWSLMKVKGDWKITSVTWTENMERIESCPFTHMESFHLNSYVCPPCPFGCDDEVYDRPGTCHVCQMELVKQQEAEYQDYVKSTFFIPNGDVQIYAAYYMPMHKKNIKGAILVSHGSAPTTHEDVGYYTKLATQLGMAVLTYDKRGCGKSTGTYESFEVARSQVWFEMLSSDLLACLNWLEGREELTGKKIGLFGGSQAGWIMPLAASKTDKMDFMIIGEGVSVSAGEEHYFSELSGDGNESQSNLSILESDRKLLDFEGELGFDPRGILKKLPVRTLWFFGSNDPVIPVDASLRTLNALNNPNFDVQILEYGDHNFMNTKTGNRHDLLEYIRPWLANKVFADQ